MKKKLTFNSENLTVDYLTLNISDLKNPESIAKYLSTFGFSSVQRENERSASTTLIKKKEINIK